MESGSCGTARPALAQTPAPAEAAAPAEAPAPAGGVSAGAKAVINMLIVHANWEFINPLFPRFFFQM